MEQSTVGFGYAGIGNDVHTMKMWGSFSTFLVLIEVFQGLKREELIVFEVG